MDKSKSPRINLPNALKHGAFSVIAILPGEDAADFRKLHALLIEEWQPEGATEEDAVLTIAKCLWSKRRIQVFMAAHAALLRGKREDVLSSALGRLQLDHDPEDLAKLLCDCPDDIREHIAKAYPRATFKTEADWAAQVHHRLTSILRSELSHDGELVEPAELRAVPFVPPYRHISVNELIEMEVTTENRINAVMDRAIKRLIQAKAMKQMLKSPSLEDRRQQAQQNYQDR
jgi:hypothetical protein